MSHPDGDRGARLWSPLSPGLPLWEAESTPRARPGCWLGGRSQVLRAQPLLQAHFLSDSCDSWQETSTRQLIALGPQSLPQSVAFHEMLHHPAWAAAPPEEVQLCRPTVVVVGGGGLPFPAGSYHLWSRVRPRPFSPPGACPLLSTSFWLTGRTLCKLPLEQEPPGAGVRRPCGWALQPHLAHPLGACPLGSHPREKLCPRASHWNLESRCLTWK